MILRPELNPTDPQEVLEYYKANYAEVHIINCTKCKRDLGIEIKGEVSGHVPNANGFTVLAIGEGLLASRVRTDGSMGYQCICGNDTRANAIEEALSPSGEFLPHELAKIHQTYDETNHKPNIKIKGNREYHETFIRERIK